MTESIKKHVQIGDWIFEVKMVRALKVSEYGKPYSAIANCNINGNAMYIDGLLTKNEQIFSKSDFHSFNEFCYKMGLKTCSYHRYQNGESVTKDVMVSPISEPTPPKAPTPSKAPIHKNSRIRLIK